MSNESKIVATVRTEAEAEMVCESLSEAGIRSKAQMSGESIGLGAAASRDVYVDEQDYDKALEVLNAAVPSEEELARLSDEAGEGSAP
jgi:superfamily II helicase